jgi:hypothetical protein
LAEVARSTGLPLYLGNSHLGNSQRSPAPTSIAVGGAGKSSHAVKWNIVIFYRCQGLMLRFPCANSLRLVSRPTEGHATTRKSVEIRGARSRSPNYPGFLPPLITSEPRREADMVFPHQAI